MCDFYFMTLSERGTVSLNERKLRNGVSRANEFRFAALDAPLRLTRRRVSGVIRAFRRSMMGA